MKAVLRFSLPDDNEEFKLALKARDFYCALHDITEAFRQKVKYSERDETTWEEARKLIWEKIDDYGLEL